jgi:hypothetical protein
VEIMNSEGVEIMGPAVRVGQEDSNGVHQWVSVLKITGSEGPSGGNHRFGGSEWWTSWAQPSECQMETTGSEGSSGGNHGSRRV